MASDFKKIIPALVLGNIKFIVIGGVAAIVHGSARTTFDLDVVYSRDHQNIKRLVQTLKPFSPSFLKPLIFLFALRLYKPKKSRQKV